MALYAIKGNDLRITGFFLLFYILSFTFISCNEEEPQYNLNGTKYPMGIKVIDLIRLNECLLPQCDENRLTRLSLENVRAIVTNDSTISVTLTFDSIIDFDICGAKLVGYNSADKVIISGLAKDGCGFLNPVFPIEEEYYLILSKIVKI